MHILVIGAGNLGLLYGWLLSQNGHRVTHLVRRRTPEWADKQITFRLFDRRREKYKTGIYTYRPHQVDTWADISRPDWIFAPLRHDQALACLPGLRSVFPETPLALMGNMWLCSAPLVSLLDARTVAAFPHHGGQLRGDVWRGALTRNLSIWAHGPERSPLAASLAEMLARCGLQPVFRPDLDQWMAVHLAAYAAQMAALLNAGNLSDLDSRQAMAYWRGVLQESMNVTRGHGIQPERYPDGRQAKLPGWLFSLKYKALFTLPVVRSAFGYYLDKGRPEAIYLCETLKTAAVEAGVETPLLDQVIPWTEAERENNGKISQLWDPNSRGYDESANQKPIPLGS